MYFCSITSNIARRVEIWSENSREPHYQGIESLTIGAVFFGTPMLGADFAAWASIGTALSSVLKQTNRDIVGVLKLSSTLAESIRLDIINLVARRAHTGNPIKIACFYECLPVPGYGKVVVNHESATCPPHYEKGIQSRSHEHDKVCIYTSKGLQRLYWGSWPLGRREQ